MAVHHPPVMLDILQEHFEELDSLWELREGVIFAPDWSLQELAELEERAETHLDGLRIGAQHSVAIARPALVGEDKGAATAATLTFMAMGNPELENEVAKALAIASPEARDGIRIGLRHSDVRRIADRLSQMASSGDPVLRASAADILAFHRLPPPQRFAELLNQPGAGIRALLYGAAGRFGGPWSVDYLEASLDGEPPHLQRIALECSARLGILNLADVCRKGGTRPQNPSAEALAFLGVVGDARDLPLLQSALAKPALARAALDGLGALGSIAAMPALIQAMTEPTLAHAAGAAFVRITGADPGRIQADEPFPPPPDLPEDEADFWNDTRPPDAARARAWWDKAKGAFTAEGRWQAGRDIAGPAPDAHFNALPLRARWDAFLGRRVRDPTRVADLELERRAALQRNSRPIP